MSPKRLQFNSRNFSYTGVLDDSKSIVNRLLIVQSHFRDLRLEYTSQADDVVFLDGALHDLENGNREFELGAGGTSFRFFLGRLSRQPGRYTVRAHPKLLARPQSDLYRALQELGTNISTVRDGQLDVNVLGWHKAKEVHVKSDVSSQFASAVLLNAWDLNKVFTIHLGKEVVSESFLNLTKTICQKSGMKFQEKDSQIIIEPLQEVTLPKLRAEVDASSLFTLACFGLLFGQLSVSSCENMFGQPDFKFLSIFKDWYLRFICDETGFHIQKQELPKSINISIASCPDLFPVLCTFLSFCEGQHQVYGAPHLVSKESNRIEKTYELLSLAGIKTKKLSDGLEIQGQPQAAPTQFQFDPDHDHRMAFAAALLAYGGWDIDLTDASVVNKSFPDFWMILGLQNG